MTIETNGLSCGYKKKCVLENITIEIQTGTAICVLGPNGVGKSTFFKTLLRQIQPISGFVYIDGRELSSFSLRELARVFAYVPQAKGYSYQFSVEDMVLMGRAAHIGHFSNPTNEDAKIAKAAVSELGIDDLLPCRYAELSGGEQQIVLIARALAQGSRYIILDEPASNLDFLNQDKLLSVIRNLTSNGVGVLMSSHSPDHAFACCEHTMIVGDNTIVMGQTNEILSSDNLTRAYGVPIEILEGVAADGSILRACCLKKHE